MKLINYLHNNNKSYGILKADGVIDLKKRIGNTYPTIKALLTADALSVAAEYQHNATDLALDEIVYLPGFKSM